MFYFDSFIADNRLLIGKSIMRMNIRKVTKLFLTLSLTIVSALTSCKSSDDSLATVNPFDSEIGNGTVARDKILVISDLHLGADLSYSECVHHLPMLIDFLNDVRQSKTIKELVIAGDMLDEWYVPSRNDTYEGKTQLDFVKKIAEKNKCVIDVLNAIADDGQITVTYAPGNHDLTITSECVKAILPKIKQARDDNKVGLGTYLNSDYKLAVEHGHRFDFFCAPDYDSPQNKVTGSILPAGYFFTRIAVNSITNPPAEGQATPVPAVPAPSTTVDDEQKNNYIYYSCWKYVLEKVIPVKDNFSEKIIRTGVNHLTESYSINDVLPYSSNDIISMNLFNGFCKQTAWEERLKKNNVMVMTDVKKAIAGSLVTEFIDEQSNVQFFSNPLRVFEPLTETRIVVFGHTHIPMIKKYKNLDGKDCIYANSGTWVDKKGKNGEKVDQSQENMHFVVIAPQPTDSKSIKVELLKYRNKKHVLVTSQTIKL